VTWELFCSPESELSKQSDRYGFKAVRINLANGYDLYKAETYKIFSLYSGLAPTTGVGFYKASIVLLGSIILLSHGRFHDVQPIDRIGLNLGFMLQLSATQ